MGGRGTSLSVAVSARRTGVRIGYKNIRQSNATDRARCSRTEEQSNSEPHNLFAVFKLQERIYGGYC